MPWKPRHRHAFRGTDRRTITAPIGQEERHSVRATTVVYCRELWWISARDCVFPDSVSVGTQSSRGRLSAVCELPHLMAG